MDKVLLCDTLLADKITAILLPPNKITPHSETVTDCVYTNLKKDDMSVEVLNAGISDDTVEFCMFYFLTKEIHSMKIRTGLPSDDNIQNLKCFLAWVNVHRSSSHIEIAYDRFNSIVAVKLDEQVKFV